MTKKLPICTKIHINNLLHINTNQYKSFTAHAHPYSMKAWGQMTNYSELPPEGRCERDSE